MQERVGSGRRGAGRTRLRRSSGWVPCVAAVLVAGCVAGRVGAPLVPGSDPKAASIAAEAAPGDAEPCYQIALLHYGRREPLSALAALAQALRRDPGHVPSLTLFAKLLHDQGRGGEGRRFFASRPPEAWPESVRLGLALLHADAGDTSAAHCLLDDLAVGAYADVARAQLAAMGLTPHPLLDTPAAGMGIAVRISPERLHDLARARWRAGDMVGAASLLQVVVSSYPEYAAAPLSLALLLSQYLYEDMGSSGARPYLDALVASHTALAPPPTKSELVEDAAPLVPPRGR